MYKQSNRRSLYFPDRITYALKEIFDYPLVIVEAPMGYGKTTAVREYLSNTTARILWQRVYDNSKNNFWNGFCKLFAELDADCSTNLSQLGFPMDSATRHEALSLIENIHLPGRTVLVIDDYHLAGGAEVDNFIEFLAINEIEHLHLVLTVRFNEFPNLEELSLKGYIKHISKVIFEFQPIDIKIYFKLCGFNLGDTKANKLYSFTEGWISALYLLMLDYKEIDSLVATANISNLIEKAVYNPLNTDLKDFLLTMCIFDYFTLEQAVYMWGNKNAETLLLKAINESAFINYDVRTKRYHIHHIFTNFLKEINKSIETKTDIYRRAANWFMKTEEYVTAMQYFYICGDFENLLLALVKDKGYGFTAENIDEYIKYIEECPNSLKEKNHLAQLTYAMQMFLYNRTALFEIACYEFIHNINMDEGLNEEFKRELMGEYELVLSFTGYNDINRMSEHHQNACKLLTHPTSIYDTEGSWTFGSVSILYMFYRESGMLSQHVKDMIKAMPYYYQLTDGHGSGAEYVMEGEWYFNAGEFENAEISVHKAIKVAQIKMKTDIILCAEFLQMRIAFVKCDCAALFELLHHMRQNLITRHDFNYLHTIELSEGFIYALLKQRDKIPERIVAGNPNNSRLMFPAFSMFNIVYGRVLLINGEYLKIIGTAEYCIELASAFSNLLGQIYTYIYLAAAYNQIFRAGEAVAAISSALETAMPDRVYMPFVENCDYVKPLLEQIYREGKYREGIARILEIYEVYQHSFEKITKEYFSVKGKPELTGREKEIAQFAAEGLTNREISERLFISTNTVKSALKTVFEKLEINSRALLKHKMEQNN